MQVEHRILVQAPAAVLFSIYRDVEHWHTWDPDTKHATLGGSFTVGSRGRLTPTKGRPVPMVLTQVEPDRSFTVESKIPLFRMVFEHELSPRDGGVEVAHRVTFSGLLSVLLGPMLVKQLNTGLPVTLARLKALAEDRAAGRATAAQN
ncbi:MAG: polyketide cyclase [Methylibium sp. NZG]|nr:MAG: polyketide cyclase [Methylibium sp. NZG]